MPEVVVSGISHRFRRLSRSEGQITHVLLTRSPLVYPRRGLSARLACVKHAASVRPEPGSNSPLNSVESHNTQRRCVHRLSRSIPARVALPHPEKSEEQRSYQRNHRQIPTQPPKGSIATCRRALQINSSTFGTLLSSQGSSAHRSPAFSAVPRGNLVKLTGSIRPVKSGARPIRTTTSDELSVISQASRPAPRGGSAVVLTACRTVQEARGMGQSSQTSGAVSRRRCPGARCGAGWRAPSGPRGGCGRTPRSRRSCPPRGCRRGPATNGPARRRRPGRPPA